MLRACWSFVAHEEDGVAGRATGMPAVVLRCAGLKHTARSSDIYAATKESSEVSVYKVGLAKRGIWLLWSDGRVESAFVAHC